MRINLLLPLCIIYVWVVDNSVLGSSPCEYNGQIYPHGAAISTHENNCYGTTCIDGAIAAWDDACNFSPKACPGGKPVTVAGQCCPKCIPTTPLSPTTPTTSTPTTPLLTTFPAAGCNWQGTFYRHGAEISRDNNNCHGLMCTKGGVVAWDAKCSFSVPDCPGGTNVDVPGQCCPRCVTTTSTTSPEPPGIQGPTTTTHSLTNGCVADGTFYPYGAKFNVTTPCRYCRCSKDHGIVCIDDCGPPSNAWSLHGHIMSASSCVILTFYTWLVVYFIR